MKKASYRRDAHRRPAPVPQLDQRIVVIDRARHELGGEPCFVEAVKIAVIDLAARREVEVSYALRLNGFLGAPFARKHEAIKALKEGDFVSFLRDLYPIPEGPSQNTTDGPDTDPTDKSIQDHSDSTARVFEVNEATLVHG